MRSSPKLRPNGWDALVVLLVLALAAGSALAVWVGGRTETGPETAVVTIDGQEADRFPPEDLLENPRTYTNNGYTLTVAYGIDYEDLALNTPAPSGKSGLYVTASDCPTQDCVRTGIITQSGQSIVCLPARIIVQLTGAESEPGAVDAVLG